MDLFNKSDLFISVIEMHKGIIYKIANSYCIDSEDKKDLVQEIILQLWKSFDKYNEQYKHSTWIYRIALNVAISFCRKEKRRKEISKPFSEGLFNTVDFAENADTDVNALFLQKFIADLKELDKALMLLYLEEKSHKEMSDIMGITETNVATKIGRIKTILKQKFSQVKM